MSNADRIATAQRLLASHGFTSHVTDDGQLWATTSFCMRLAPGEWFTGEQTDRLIDTSRSAVFAWLGY